MTLTNTTLIIITSCLVANGGGQITDTVPEIAFMNGLARIEREYISSLRKASEKAATIQVFRITPRFGELGPFNEVQPEGFEISSGGKAGVYPVLKASEVIDDKNLIQIWARAVLPEENLPVSLCTPSLGYAVRFTDANGEKIYASTICLECHIAPINFPRYSGIIGVSVETIGKLLELSGFKAEIHIPMNKGEIGNPH